MFQSEVVGFFEILRTFRLCYDGAAQDETDIGRGTQIPGDVIRIVTRESGNGFLSLDTVDDVDDNDVSARSTAILNANADWFSDAG